MKPGDIVLTPLPQVDGQVKPRPAVVLDLLAPFDDPLACGISTQLRHAVPGFDEFMQPHDDDFRQSGLKAASVSRVLRDPPAQWPRPSHGGRQNRSSSRTQAGRR